MECAIQTVLCWSITGDLSCVEFYRGEDHYVFVATPETLQASLRLVGRCAADPELNLTWQDAEQITRSMRQIVGATREAVPVESAVDDGAYDNDRWWLLSILGASILFWGWVFTLVIRAWQ